MTPNWTAAADHRTHAALSAVLAHLRAADYVFVTPTPATHRRILQRPQMTRASDLRDVFGWSLPFEADLLDPALLQALHAADAIEPVGAGWRAKVRVSSLGGELFLHSAFPPSDSDAVFFGPDTYRFARFLETVSDGRRVGVAMDIGTGAGAGAVTVARHFRPRRLIASDVNPRALSLASINLAAAGVQAELSLADGLADGTELLDLIVANPPFIAGDEGRTYRDGGDLHGARMSLDWTLEGVRRLALGGRLLLYTGSAIVQGRDGLLEALQRGLDSHRFMLNYAEIDPDIFGGQLAAPAYHDVERIAAIGAVIVRRA